MPTILTLVRHADSVPPTVGGPSELDRPLSEKGLGEAEQLVGELSVGGFMHAWSSPYRRAIQTIAPTTLAIGIPIQERPDAREWDSGLEPTPDWEPLYRNAWGEPDRQHGGGESLTELKARASLELGRAIEVGITSGSVLLASHGTWIATALQSQGIAVDVEFWLTMPMPAVYRWDWDGHRFKISGPGIDPVSSAPRGMASSAEVPFGSASCRDAASRYRRRIDGLRCCPDRHRRCPGPATG